MESFGVDSSNFVLQGITLVTLSLLRAASIGIRASFSRLGIVDYPICYVLMEIDRGKRYTLSDVDREVVTIDVVCTKGIASSQSHIVDVEDIPIFFGSDCIEGFLLWVEDVEKLFKTQPIPEREMVKMVASYLDGDVGLWCDHMQESRQQQGKCPIQTWRWLKRLIVKQFFSDLYELYLEKTGQPIIRKEAKVMENDISLCQETVEAKVEEKEQVIFLGENLVDEDLRKHDNSEVEAQEIQGMSESKSVMTLENHESSKLDLNSIVDQTRELGKEEYFDSQLPYFNLIYGINFMIIPPKYTESWASQVEELIFLTRELSTSYQDRFKTNSRSSSFQVEESDVGQKSDYFTCNKTKRRKRRAIKKSDWRIGNSRVNRLFATVISRKLMF